MTRPIKAPPAVYNLFIVAGLFALALLPVACERKASGLSAEQQAARPVPIPFAPGAEDGQWLMAAKDYANTRFSGLDQINAGNAKDLKVAWTFSTGLVQGTRPRRL